MASFDLIFLLVALFDFSTWICLNLYYISFELQKPESIGVGSGREEDVDVIGHWISTPALHLIIMIRSIKPKLVHSRSYSPLPTRHRSIVRRSKPNPKTKSE